MNVRAIHRLNEWRIWAEEQLVESARRLDHDQLATRFEIGQGTLLSTLEHLQRSEEIWLLRLACGKDTNLRDQACLADLGAITAAWGISNAGWSEYLAGLNDDELMRHITGRNSRGAPYNMPVLDCLLHVHTHAAYTMAQANNMLKQLGTPIPDLAMARLSREEHPAHR